MKPDDDEHSISISNVVVLIHALLSLHEMVFIILQIKLWYLHCYIFLFLYLQKSSCHDERGLTCVEQKYSRHRQKVADNQCLICYKVFGNSSQCSEHFKCRA